MDVERNHQRRGVMVNDDGSEDVGNLSDGWTLTITAKEKGKKTR